MNYLLKEEEILELGHIKDIQSCLVNLGLLQQVIQCMSSMTSRMKNFHLKSYRSQQLEDIYKDKLRYSTSNLYYTNNFLRYRDKYWDPRYMKCILRYNRNFKKFRNSKIHQILEYKSRMYKNLSNIARHSLDSNHRRIQLQLSKPLQSNCKYRIHLDSIEDKLQGIEYKFH